jgi:hypothetical protein
MLRFPPKRSKLHRRDAEFAENAEDNTFENQCFERMDLCDLGGSVVNSLISHDPRLQ